jgi:hypothetical protein
MIDLDAPIARQPKLPRFLCHLYQRLLDRKLNLVIGAGISVDAGVPQWHGLLERLAENPPELASDLLHHRTAGLNPEYLGQILYHRFKNTCDTTCAPEFKEATVDNGWAKSIHDAIYRDVPENIDDCLKAHPYLSSLRDLARKAPLVISFNFDDILSDAIGRKIELDGGGGRPCSVVWQPPLVDRPDATTIYHVNGILPRVELKKRSPRLVFTEDSFADALARSAGISAEYMFLRFVQNTMLLLGLSLSDSSLKDYLRRNKDQAPANHHYMVYWIRDEKSVSQNQMQDIFEANLELYNLITIFLSSIEIMSFLDLLNLVERDFRDIIENFGQDERSRYHFYIAGPVGAGKSTLLEHLRCFSTHEEWTRPPPREMYLASSKLTPAQAKKVNAFVYNELKEKNLRMDNAGVGIHFMDRAPLDLYAFSKDDKERKRKTADLRASVTRDKPLQAGEVIFLWAKGTTLVKRNLSRGRLPSAAGEANYFNNQTKTLTKVYNPVVRLQTDELSSGEIAKRVARHVLLEEYSPIDLNKVMNRFDS